VSDPGREPASGGLLLRHAGAIVSGRLEAPLLDADAVYCVDGRIKAVGRLDDVHPGGDVATVDVDGATVVPGLIDSHVHPVVGDFTARHNALGWIESYLHGGTTTLISAGEPHFPGRPRDAAGTKALAILAHKSYASLRPGGAKVHAGAVLLEPGLVEADFAEMADAGVRLLGEIGISGVYEVAEARPMVESARRHGFVIPVHVGGASVPGSSVIGADTVIDLAADVAAHINGGPTAPSAGDLIRIIDESEAAIEVVQAGNVRALVEAVHELRRRDRLDRLQIGSDTPSGTGIVPLAMLRVLAYCAALAGLPPEVGLCAATGSTAARYGLDVGEVAPGRGADLTILDAPRGSSANTAFEALTLGDTPAVAGVVTDGVVRVTHSRVSPPPKRSPGWASLVDVRV
jgi:enamidase